MNATETYYSILGISDNASKDEIKKAYRSLQMKYHPDRNNSSIESVNMTQKINEAYETLSDADKRREYDMFAKRGININPMNMSMPMQMQEEDISNIFNMIFGQQVFKQNLFGQQGFGQQHPMRHMPMHTPLQGVHIFNGTTTPLNFQQAMNKPVPIIKSMLISMETVLAGGTVPLEIERWMLENGNKVFENETIYVEIPAGIDEGEFIILRNQGNVISESCKGDIKIAISVRNDSPFKRNGLDIIFNKTLTLKESLCGFSFDLRHINGKKYTLNNSKGHPIVPGYDKIYPEMGLKRGEHKGNMIIHFEVEFPPTLTEEQIAKLREIL